MRISDWSSDVCSSDLLLGTYKGRGRLWSMVALRRIARMIVLGLRFIDRAISRSARPARFRTDRVYRSGPVICWKMDVVLLAGLSFQVCQRPFLAGGAGVDFYLFTCAAYRSEVRTVRKEGVNG